MDWQYTATLLVLSQAFWSKCRWEIQSEVAKTLDCHPDKFPSCLPPAAGIWAIICLSLACTLVETFLRQPASVFGKVNTFLSLVWHLEINKEVFCVYKQTIDRMSGCAASLSGSSNVLPVTRLVLTSVFFSTFEFRFLGSLRIKWLGRLIWNLLRAKKCKNQTQRNKKQGNIFAQDCVENMASPLKRQIKEAKGEEKAIFLCLLASTPSTNFLFRLFFLKMKGKENRRGTVQTKGGFCQQEHWGG